MCMLLHSKQKYTYNTYKTTHIEVYIGSILIFLSSKDHFLSVIYV